MIVEVPQQAANTLALKHLPWVSEAEICHALESLNWHPENAKELAPFVANNYNGAFRKGMEVALRSVRIVSDKLVIDMPDSTVVELPQLL